MAIRDETLNCSKMFSDVEVFDLRFRLLKIPSYFELLLISKSLLSLFVCAGFFNDKSIRVLILVPEVHVHSFG